MYSIMHSASCIAIILLVNCLNTVYYVPIFYYVYHQDFRVFDIKAALNSVIISVPVWISGSGRLAAGYPASNFVIVIRLLICSVRGHNLEFMTGEDI